MHQPDHDHEDHNQVPSQVEHSASKETEDEVARYQILSFRSCAPKQYEGFIYANWLNSLRYGNDMFKLMESRPYYNTYKQFIAEILNRENSRLRVAVLSDDHDVALGWAVDEGDILHYVFVPEDYRKHGIGASLVPKDFKTISHITTIGMAIWQKKFPNVRFNPFV